MAREPDTTANPARRSFALALVWPMHTGEQIGIDDFQADRSPDRKYRTTPLRGLFARAKGGFYHDGRFATLRDVVEHYDQQFKLQLSNQQADDLVEYLKSL